MTTLHTLPRFRTLGSLSVCALLLAPLAACDATRFDLSEGPSANSCHDPSAPLPPDCPDPNPDPPIDISAPLPPDVEVAVRALPQTFVTDDDQEVTLQAHIRGDEDGTAAGLVKVRMEPGILFYRVETAEVVCSGDTPVAVDFAGTVRFVEQGGGPPAPAEPFTLTVLPAPAEDDEDCLIFDLSSGGLGVLDVEGSLRFADDVCG